MCIIFLSRSGHVLYFVMEYALLLFGNDLFYYKYFFLILVFPIYCKKYFKNTVKKYCKKYFKNILYSYTLSYNIIFFVYLVYFNDL